MSERTKTRAPRALRRQVARALAKAAGPKKVFAFQRPDGVIMIAPKGTYVWQGTLPNGEPFMFTTETPKLEYAALVEPLAANIHKKTRGWRVIQHTPECRQAGVGCICTPAVVAGENREEA